MRDDGRTDAELLASTARGDGAAFAVLVRRHIRAAVLLAAQLLGDRDEAEDVAQDAFTVVHRDARTFDATRAFGPWLYAIVRRLAANRRSRERRRARLFGTWRRTDVADPAPSRVEDALLARVDAAADAAAVVRALAELSPMQRACFELVVIRELSTEEVAAMHGISESTVRQHVFRARTTLRGLLDARGARSTRSTGEPGRASNRHPAEP